MKKSLLYLLLIVPIVIFGQEKPVYNIGILNDIRTPELEPLLVELTEEITNVVGEDAIISFSDEHVLSNNFDLETARQEYQQLLNSEVDIIIAFGLVNNALMLEQNNFPKPVILFGSINSDFLNIDKEEMTSDTENFIYLLTSGSYINDLATFYELAKFNRLGVIVHKPYLEVFPYQELFEKEFEKYDAEYEFLEFETYDDIESRVSDFDALYLAEAFYLSPSEISQLAKKSIELGIATFTSNSIDEVKQGILATNQAEENLSQFFRRIALTVESYIQGESLADLPVYISFDDKLTLNYNTAEKIRLPLKYSLIAQTDFIGNWDERESDKQYNLLEVMGQVLDSNLTLRASQQDVALSEKDVKTAWADYIPSVTATATGLYTDPELAEASMGLNPEFTADGVISLNQNVFSADANANIGTRKDLLGSQQQRFYADQLDAVFESSNAYFNALILKQNLQISATNLDLTKKNLEIASENFEAGQAGKSDVLRFTSELAQDMQNLIESANSLQQGYYELNQLLNNPIDYSIDVDDTELEKGLFEQYNYQQLRQLLDDPKLRTPFVKFLVEEAKRNAPELKALDFDLSAVGRSIRLNSAGRFLPDLALQGQFSQNFDRSGLGVNPNFALDNFYTVSLNVSIPLIDQNRQNINRQIALIQKDQLNLNKDNINLAIETNVNTAVVNMINEVANIELSQLSEEAAEEALDLTQTSYSNGAVNIVQLLDAQNNYLNARVARANATYNYLLASLRLERFIGYYFLLHTKEENDEFVARFFQYLNDNNNGQ